MSDSDKATETTTTDDDPAEGGDSRLTLPLWVTGALALALVAALAAVVVLWLDRSERVSDEESIADALAAGETYAVKMSTYHYRHLDRDFGWAEKGATEAFAKDYKDTTDALRKIIVPLQAEAIGSVEKSAARMINEDKVEVLVFVKQSIKNRARTSPKIDRNAMSITLKRQGDRWLVSDMRSPTQAFGG